MEKKGKEEIVRFFVRDSSNIIFDWKEAKGD